MSKGPNWSKLYRRHSPEHTCPASRHAKIIASDMLRHPKSPLRKLLIDEGYEPDHMAASIESAVVSLWKAREMLWKVDPVGQQRIRDRQLKKALAKIASRAIGEG